MHGHDVASLYNYTFLRAFLSFSAFSSTVSGTLVIRQQPTDNERTYVNHGTVNVPLLRDNRMTVSLGDTIDPVSTPDGDKPLRCVAGHQNDNTMIFTPPVVV